MAGNVSVITLYDVVVCPKASFTTDKGTFYPYEICMSGTRNVIYKSVSFEPVDDTFYHIIQLEVRGNISILNKIE